MSVPTFTPIRSEAASDRPQPCASHSGGESAVARAILARFVAELFSDAVDDSLDGRLNGGIRDEIARAARTLNVPSRRIDAVFDAAPSNGAAARDARNQLLGHTVRSSCPPYELEYGRGEVFQQSNALADLAGFYAAFGLEVSGPLAERADHLVAELEVLSVAAMKEHSAERDGDSESRQICRDAQRLFLKEHASRWMTAFFSRVRQANVSAFFNAAAELGDALLQNECAEFEIPEGPKWLELRSVEEEDTTISCGKTEASQVELGPTLAAAMNARNEA